MNTQQRILQAITNFDQMYNHQVNLSSEAARIDLSEMIYNAVMKQDQADGTYNDQQMHLFTNIDDQEHK